MKVADARKMMEAAKKQAASMDKAVSIIVVDAAGIPILLDRNGEPGAMTSVIAEGKAVASAFTGRDSAALQGMAERAPAILALLGERLSGRFAAHQGAVALLKDGDVVGAVGVSGATSEEDEQIAKAGAAAFA